MTQTTHGVLRERIDDLHAIRKYCMNDKEAMDLWAACHALANTESMIFHEIEERLQKYLWENNDDYKDYCQNEAMYFRGLER